VLAWDLGLSAIQTLTLETVWMACGHGLVGLFVEGPFALAAIPYAGVLAIGLARPEAIGTVFPVAALQAVVITLLVFWRRARRAG
jgi:hypothetical protein